MFETKENYFSPYKVKKGTFFLYNSGIYTRLEKRQLISRNCIYCCYATVIKRSRA